MAAQESQLVQPLVLKNKNRECFEADISITEGKITDLRRALREIGSA